MKKERFAYVLGFATGILIQFFCVVLLIHGAFTKTIEFIFTGSILYILYFLLTIKIEIKEIKKYMEED
jgi:hypothetical protein